MSYWPGNGCPDLYPPQRRMDRILESAQLSPTIKTWQCDVHVPSSSSEPTVCIIAEAPNTEEAEALCREIL